MEKEILFTARNTFDSEFSSEFSWQNYLEWSKLYHLKELVSLDGILNDLCFTPDFDSESEWENIVTDQNLVTVFFNSIDYIMNKVKDLKYFNLLAVIKEPKSENANLNLEFDFIGYDLVEKDGDISALTNCGGFDETFSPQELNQYGLISEYTKAKKVQIELIKNNPEEHQADCYLYEVWRHKTIGRKQRHL